MRFTKGSGRVLCALSGQVQGMGCFDLVENVVVEWLSGRVGQP